MADTKRIYVVVPETVTVAIKLETTSGADSTYTQLRWMSAGRLMAQCAHVVSRMRVALADKYANEAITTIILSVRNSKEFLKVEKELMLSTVRTWVFEDTNPNFYGTPNGVKTALCTAPAERGALDEYIGHLELYER